MERNIESEITIPKSYIKNVYFARLGIIFFNIALGSLLMFICTMFSPILLAVLWILGFMLILISIGSIFVIIPGYWGKLTSFISNSSSFVSRLIEILPYILVVGIVASAVSIVFLFLDKNNKHKGRIIGSIIFAILLVICLVFILAGGLR